LIKTALQMPELGERYAKEGDEEEAYVLFMRFIYLAVEAKKLGEPRRSQLRPIINNAIISKCMERAEQLNKSLERRYESLKQEKAMQDAAFELVKAPGRELIPPPSNAFAGGEKITNNSMAIT
jgi:USP8 dimerisation domain